MIRVIPFGTPTKVDKRKTVLNYFISMVDIVGTLERVAMAITVTVSHRELRAWVARDSSPIRFKGSMTQTSPRLPENMQRVSTPLTPSVRLKLISNTLPPLSQRRASVGISVN